MMADGYVIGRSLAGPLQETVRRVMGQSPRLTPGVGQHPDLPEPRYQGKLTSALAAPSNGATSPTTATMRVWVPDPADTTTPPDFIQASPVIEITVVNRDKSLSAASGSWIKIEFLNGEWSPYWVGC